MQAISEEDIVQRIHLENPWWEGDHAIGKPFREFRPRAYFDLFLPLIKAQSVRRAIVLMGPRRVGKTVMIYHAIQALLSEGVLPQSLRSEEHTSELQSLRHLVCRLLLE